MGLAAQLNVIRWAPLNVMSNTSYIRITRQPYEEPDHLDLVWDVANGSQRASIETYLNADALSALADSLEAFPRHSTDVVLFELGSERPEDKWSYYFRLRAFTTSSTGHCALQFRLNNNSELPDRSVAEFCILAEPAQINRFGALLREFRKLRHSRLEWTHDSGELVE